MESGDSGDITDPTPDKDQNGVIRPNFSSMGGQAVGVSTASRFLASSQNTANKPGESKKLIIKNFKGKVHLLLSIVCLLSHHIVYLIWVT